MNNAVAVGFMHGAGQRLGELGRPPIALCASDAPLLVANGLRKRSAFDVFEGNVRLTVVVSDVMNGNDVRMIELGEGIRLAAEAVEVLPLGLLSTKDHLERHHAIQRNMACFVNDSHATTPKFVEDFVGWNRGQIRLGCGTNLASLPHASN
jgi:hypothetical protein